MQKRISLLSTQIGNKMKEKKLTLVTAESCSGGGLSYYLSLNPESSPILERGYVTYSNQAKESVLKVSAYTLQTHGAVSKEVAKEMAKGALENSCAQVALAITGIAAPDIKKKEKGIVFIAFANHLTETEVHELHIAGSRTQFCQTIVLESLQYLMRFLENI